MNALRRNGIPRALCLRLATCLLVLAAGCASGPTAVNQGQLFRPGVPEYDAFFAKLHKLQEIVIRAPLEREESRKALASELGLEPNASVELMDKQLEKRVAELKKHGSKLSIELIGLQEDAEETDAVVSSIDATGSAETTPLTRALEHAAKQAVKLAVKLRTAKRDADQLQMSLPRLDSELDARFKLLGPRRANEARRNLSDARILLPTLTRGVESAVEENRQLVDLLAKAAPPSDDKKRPDKRQPKPAGGSKPGAAKPKAASDDYQP